MSAENGIDNSLKTLFNGSLRKQLVSDLKLKNMFQAPLLEKIVINTGIKSASQDFKAVAPIVDAISRLAGQQAVKTLAKKSIAGFKIRDGMTVGVKVVLRGKNMYQFLEKLVRVSLPLVRDFRGLKPKFDSSGNYNLGINDWMIFPEIDYENVPGVRGLNITMSIRNGGCTQSLALLKGMGMPFCND